MYVILLIKSNGDIVEKNVKNIDEDSIYKFCNYKNNNDFKYLHNYKYNDSKFYIYGKVNGRANSENKYDLPPPIDTNLYFGTLCIIKKQENNYSSTNIEEWNKVYEHLFGGFEDLDKEEERSIDSEIYSEEDYTNEGYLKDNFVVDDDELCEEEYITDDENIIEDK